MAAPPTQPVPASVGKDTSAEHEETKWGEDWESAFQSEDDTFFPAEKEDFFLEENTPSSPAGGAAQNLTSPPGKSDGTLEPGAASGVPSAKTFTGLKSLFSFFLSCKTTAIKLFLRLQSFPIFIRAPLYALPFLLIGVFFILTAAPKKPQLPHLPVSNSQTHSPVTGPGSRDEHTNAAELKEVNELHPGKIRKKWAFPAFIIPIKPAATDQPITFVLVDITLIAYLADQEEPPAEKKVFVRDIIYQFFQNKTLEELRRFSLARGDMNRELRVWLKKQWPDAPIETIIFNQYHLS